MNHRQHQQQPQMSQQTSAGSYCGNSAMPFRYSNNNHNNNHVQQRQASSANASGQFCQQQNVLLVDNSAQSGHQSSNLSISQPHMYQGGRRIFNNSYITAAQPSSHQLTATTTTSTDNSQQLVQYYHHDNDSLVYQHQHYDYESQPVSLPEQQQSIGFQQVVATSDQYQQQATSQLLVEDQFADYANRPNTVPFPLTTATSNDFVYNNLEQHNHQLDPTLGYNQNIVGQEYVNQPQEYYSQQDATSELVDPSANIPILQTAVYEPVYSQDQPTIEAAMPSSRQQQYDMMAAHPRTSQIITQSPGETIANGGPTTVAAPMTTNDYQPQQQVANIPRPRQPQGEYIDLRYYGNISQDWLDTICRHMIEHMNHFGICVIDNFLGSARGDLILNEVQQLYSSRNHSKGRLVNNKLNSKSPSANGQASIRSDRVIWIEDGEIGCDEINTLIQTLCSVITNSSRLSLYSNNTLDKIVINKRTKAHVACYPGNGTYYVKHVDNPNNDGRVITAIYYINKNWNTKRDGGMLRMFPAGMDQVANIEPLFDRVLFFWSDRRNPHEVLPAYKDRFAITVWYIGETRS